MAWVHDACSIFFHELPRTPSHSWTRLQSCACPLTGRRTRGSLWGCFGLFLAPCIRGFPWIFPLISPANQEQSGTIGGLQIYLPPRFHSGMFHSDCRTGGTLSQKHSTQPLLAEFTAWKQTADVGGSEEIRHKRPSGRGPVHARHCSDSSAMAVINASPPQGLCSHCFL